MEADRALRGIGGERHWKAARDGYDLLTDLAPKTGVCRTASADPDPTEIAERKSSMLPFPRGRQAPPCALTAALTAAPAAVPPRRLP